MKKKNFNKRLLLTAASVAASAAVAHASPQNFTPGDIVVLETTAQTGQTIGTEAATLVEINPLTGSTDATVSVPTATVGSNNPLTIDYATQAGREGLLTLSENQQYLTFAGFNTAPETTTAATNNASATVGLIGNSFSSLDTTTTLSSGNESVRVATTIDGNEFYVAEAHGNSTSGGLNYVPGRGGNFTSTELIPGNSTSLDPRSLAVLGGSGGVLAVGAGSSTFSNAGFSNIASGGSPGHGIFSLTGGSGGAPTNSPVSGTQITTNQDDGSDVVFDKEPGNTYTTSTYHGYNTLYLVSGGDEAVEKFEFDGTNFDLVQSVTSFNSGQANALTLVPTVNGVDVFYTEPNGIYELTAYDQSSEGFESPTSSLFASPGSNSSFFGIAGAPVPEPTSLGVLGLGSLGLLGRRRRRSA